jgi:hypothetical protein
LTSLVEVPSEWRRRGFHMRFSASPARRLTRVRICVA